MSEIVKITDFDSRVLSLIMSQYENSEKLKSIIQAMDTQAQAVENALFEIRDLFWVDSAEGDQLDVIGNIFNELREGRSDTEYRTAIREKAGLRFSGEPESIIGIIKSLFEGTYVLYFPGYPAIPASFYIATDGIITQTQLDRISPAGVQGYLADYLVDANDNPIIDANDEFIYGLRS